MPERAVPRTRKQLLPRAPQAPFWASSRPYRTFLTGLYRQGCMLTVWVFTYVKGSWPDTWIRSWLRSRGLLTCPILYRPFNTTVQSTQDEP